MVRILQQEFGTIHLILDLKSFILLIAIGSLTQKFINFLHFFSECATQRFESVSAVREKKLSRNGLKVPGKWLNSLFANV